MTTLFNSAHTQNNPSLHGSHAPRQSPLILVVEDHADTRYFLRCLMEIHGYMVAEAVNGEQAIEMAARMQPDLILMDMTLPLINGLECMRRIRGMDTLRAVPIVFLSGRAEAANRAAALAAGCDDYLVKPFNIEQLENAVKRFLVQQTLPV